jgi:hypothetical protein
MRISPRNDSHRMRLPRETDRSRIPFSAALIAAVVVVLGVSSGVAYAQTPAEDQYEGKTTICHRTGSQKNPWVVITVSNNALPAHKAHGDTLVGPNGTCPGPPIVLAAGAGDDVPPGTPQSGGSLPFAGLQLSAVVAWALALVLVGIALAIAGRRGPTRTTGGDRDGS